MAQGTAVEQAAKFAIVRIDQVVESETNPRKHFAKDALQDLTKSVAEKGVLVPLLVRYKLIGSGDHRMDGYEIVAGARRYRAAKAAGIDEIPILIRELDDEQALEVQVIENLQRADVHPLEEAEGYKQLLAKGKYEIETLADKVGKSTSYVYQRLKLTELAPAVKKAFEEEKITAGHAILLARLQPNDQAAALKEGGRYGSGFCSVRDLSRWIQEHIHLKVKSTPWDLKDATLLAGAGSCSDCPKRSANNLALFSDIGKDDVCTDPTCFDQKMRNHLVRIQDSLKKQGKEAVLVSVHSYDVPKGALSSDKWKTAAVGSCDYVVTGLLVDSGWHDGDHKRGSAVHICAMTNLCKVHWVRSGSHSYASTIDPATRAKERKTKALEAGRVEALRQIAIKVKTWDLNAAAVRFAHHVPFDAQKLACKVLGIWPKDGKTGGFDFREKLKAHIAASGTGPELQRVFAVLTLVPGYGRWGDGYYSSEEIPMLRKAGKSVGVNVEKIERNFVQQAAAKHKQKAKAVKKSQTSAKKKAA